MDKALFDALIMTDDDRDELISVAVEGADYNACFDMVVEAMDNVAEIGATSKIDFVTKLTLIARRAYLCGYMVALNDVQLLQQAGIDELQQREGDHSVSEAEGPTL